MAPTARKTLLTALITLLLAGCHRHDPRDAAKAIQSIERDLRHDHLAQAKLSAEKRALQWQDRPQTDPYVTFRLLDAEALLAEGKAAPAEAILAPLHTANRALAARRDVDLGNALAKLNRHADAMPLVESGIASASATAQSDVLLTGMIVKGMCLRAQRDYTAEDSLYQEAIAEADRRGNAYYRAMALNSMGVSRLRRSLFEDAIPYFEKASSLLDPKEYPRLSTSYLSNLAECYTGLGNTERALEMQERLIVIQQRIGPTANLMNSYGQAGLSHAAAGDLPQAIAFYGRALDVGRKIDMPQAAATWAVNLAMAEIGTQDWAGAKLHAEEASRPGENDAYLTFVQAAIAAGQSRHTEAERLYREVTDTADITPDLRWTAYVGLAKLSEAAGDIAASNVYFERATDLILRTRSKMAQPDSQISFLAQPIRVYQDFVEALVRQGDTEKALEVSESSRAQMLHATPATASSLKQAARAASGVFVSYWIAPARCFAWVVTARQVALVPLSESESTIKQWVAAYREEIERGGRDPLTNPASAGRKLYAALIQPLAEYIPKGSSLIVAPDGPLNELNLETLPVFDGRPHYWIEDVTLSVAPSLGLLSTPAKASAPGAPILVVGDPEPVDTYPRLPSASREIEALRRRFPDRRKILLVRHQATATRYRGEHPEHFALIHFATHGEGNRQVPLDSAVILSPDPEAYRLYARDIKDQPLTADLVTVSACKSAGAKSYAGEGLIGFPWAFLRAGAHNVIAGLWDLPDGPTAELMDGLYAGIEQSQTPTRALRAAKLIFLRSPNANLRKPYYWGPLQVYRRTIR